MADENPTASLCPRCLRWKAPDEFYNHKRKRTGKCTACKLCMDFARAFWLADNPAKAKQVEAEAREKRREISRVQVREWAVANRARKNATRKAWREANRARDTAYTKKWQAANRELVTANTVRRRARKLQATPAWANDFFIAEAYRLAKLREKVCGGKWHVDHMVPLRSKLVCGLHVENNLQVIPKSLNQRKSNLHWPDMP